MDARGNFIHINKWLLPLSWLYGLGVKLRNLAFEMNLLKSRSFSIPIISVGNITVGGTGKTPHVEYLIELLKDSCEVAVLSRGYKRKSHGFVRATNDTPMQEIGDEPFQMKKKYPDVTVAVDKNRCHGIDMLTSHKQDKDIDVILLDDAFQHRYVNPGINILLVDYHRLIVNDRLLPAGRLREPLSGKNRADVVIVTKCPKDLRPMEYRVTNKTMNLYAYQTLYFTTLEYSDLKKMFDNGNNSRRSLDSITQDEHILLLTGIASPKQMIQDLKPYTQQLTPLTFGDHHRFTKKDIQRLNDTFDRLPKPRSIITTEKDAARLYDIEGLSDDVKRNIFILPVHVKFMLGQEETFNQYITGYVRKNSRNSILVKRKDDNKSKNSNHPGDRPRTISFRNN